MAPTGLCVFLALACLSCAKPPPGGGSDPRLRTVRQVSEAPVAAGDVSELQPSSGDASEDDTPEEISDEDAAAYFNSVDLNNVTAPEEGVPEGDLVPILAKRKQYLGNLMELGPYFEGDIILPPKRNGLRPQSTRWPGGVIPYVFTDNFAASDMALFKAAFQDYQKYTCIRFVKRSDQANYVSITRRANGCQAIIGNARQGGQNLNIQVPGCNNKGTIIHELMHAVGFWHEQNRGDRDNYITVHMNNVDKDQRHNFVKRPELTPFGIRYDYGSIMHYSRYAFGSPEGAITMTPKKPLKGAIMGQIKGFSNNDVRKINRMYNCKNYLQ